MNSKVAPEIQTRPTPGAIAPILVALCSILALASISPARAASVTWDAATVTGTGHDGSGTWSTSNANWASGGSDANWATGNDAVIGVGGTAGAIAVSTVTANSITFNPVTSGSYTLSGGTITLTGSGAIVTNAAVARISSVIAGSVGLTTSGAGALTLGGAGANTYTGTTSVTSGTLTFDMSGYAANNGMYTNVTLGAVNVSSGATVGFYGTSSFADAYYFTNDTFSGSGTILKTGAGYMRIATTTTALSSFSGTINVQAGTLGINTGGGVVSATSATLNIASGASFDVRTGGITLDQLTGAGTISDSFSNGSVSVGNNGGSSTFPGSIQNGAAALSLTKNGAGTLTLTGANTYTLATTINSGTLQLGSGGTTGSLSSSTAISGSAGATLAFDRSNAVTQGTDFTATAISGGLGLAQLGGGTLTLSSSNTYSGGTTLAAGTVNINADAALGGTSGAVTFSGASTLQAGTNNITLASARGITFNSGVTGTIDTQANTMTINGVIGGATGALTKIGSGTLILGGVDTYGGTTAINNGTLRVNNSLVNSAVTVNGGGGLGGTGTVGSAVIVNGGGAINLVDGSTGTLTLSNGLTIGNNATPSMLDFEGSGSSFDLLNDSAGALTVSGSTAINITALTGLTPGTYNLITFGSSGGLSSLYLGATFAGGKNLSLLSTGTSEELIVAGSAVYWKGGNATSSWNASGPTNWTSDAAGTSGTSLAVSSPTANVNFNANGVSGPVTASLGANYDIGGLNFTSGATGATTVSDGTFGLTIEGGGITVNAGAGAATIGVKGVTVNTSQVWVNNSSNLFTVSSAVSGSAATSSTTTLTVGGGGTGGVLLSGTIGDGTGGGQLALAANSSGGPVVLTANNSYNGGTTVSSGTLQVGNGGAAGTLGSGAVMDNGVLLFNRSDSPTVSNAIGGSGSLVQAGGGALILTGSSTYSGTTTISSGTLQLGDGSSNNGYVTGNITDKGTLAFANPAAQTYNSAVSGSGGLIKSGAGLLTLGGANTYTGSTTVSTGTMNVTGAVSSSSPIIVGSNGSTGATFELTSGLNLASLTVASGATNSVLSLNPAGGTISYGINGTTTLNSALTVSKTNQGGNWAQIIFTGITGTAAGAGNDALAFSNPAGAQFYVTGNAGTYNYSGNVHFLAGVYYWQGVSILSSSANLTLDSGASLLLNAGSNTFAFNALNGAGILAAGFGTTPTLVIGSAGGSGAFSGVLYNNGGVPNIVKTGIGTEIFTGANTYTGTTMINQGTLQLGNGGATGSLSSSSAISGSAGATLAYDLSSSGTVGNSISGGINLTQEGSGTLTIPSTSNLAYTGTTAVSAGKLIVSGSLSSTGSVAVASGATLEVDGLVNNSAAISGSGTLAGSGSIGPATIAAGGTLEPGFNSSTSTAGTLTAHGNVVLTNSASNFSIRLGVATQTDSDQLAFASGSVSLNNATLAVTLGSGFTSNPPTVPGLTDIILSGGYNQGASGTFAQGGTINVAGYQFAILYGYDPNTQVVDANGTDVALELTVVPEPGTWAMMLCGLGMLAGLQRRRFSRLS